MEHFYHIFMVPIQNLVYNSSLQLNFTIKSLGKLEVRKKKKKTWTSTSVLYRPVHENIDISPVYDLNKLGSTTVTSGADEVWLHEAARSRLAKKSELVTFKQAETMTVRPFGIRGDQSLKSIDISLNCDS